MMREEHGPPVPELARRMTVCSCRHDPARALVPVLTAMPAPRHPARRHPGRLRLRPPRRRRLGHPAARRRAQLVQDLHPSDRGPRGTHDGAIIANGNLYCPATPRDAAGTRTPGPRRHPGTSRRARPADRRDRPLQARPDHQRRRRRLPPRGLPRGHGQDPLPAPPGLHDPGPRPARDPHPARTPAGLLHPADHHRPAGRGRQDPRRNTTTRRRRTGGPTPGAPAPNGPSPPPRTPPATTSPAAGPGSWA